MRTVVITTLTIAVAAGSFAGLVLAAGKAKPGLCGENMYYSMKMHKCVDARDSGKPTI